MTVITYRSLCCVLAVIVFIYLAYPSANSWLRHCARSPACLANRRQPASSCTHASQMEQFLAATSFAELCGPPPSHSVANSPPEKHTHRYRSSFRHTTHRRRPLLDNSEHAHGLLTLFSTLRANHCIPSLLECQRVHRAESSSAKEACSQIFAKMPSKNHVFFNTICESMENL